MSSIEQELILSHFSYPKYFNGSDWNTVINKSRRDIPQYLHEDLPKLKFQPLREQFKKMNQIQCPRLTYFNDQIIRQKMKAHCHGKKCSDEQGHRKREVSEVDRQRAEIDSIRSELQYALLTSKRESNVIRKLIGKVTDLQSSSPIKPKKKTRSQSVFRAAERAYFQNTLGIVLSARKQRLSGRGQPQSRDESIDKKVQSIAMLPIE